MSLDSFQEILSSVFQQQKQKQNRRGGGRRPQEPHQKGLDENDDDDDGRTSTGTDADTDHATIATNDTWFLKPLPDPTTQSRLTIVQITDVYTLDNFASLKTLIQTIRASRADNGNNANDKVITMLTGDFLAPYLLSSIDHGKGMMMAINETPIDYLTWGNHEADIPHKQVCQHVQHYQGTFINSNMQSHESMKYPQSVPYEIINLTSRDGQQTHRIGLVAVLSNDPKLYSHFPKDQPAFGGATIEDPWETLAHYQTILQQEHGCDLVIPLEHCYVPENTRTCQQFDFPLILSGHDHHRIDQKIHGTRLIKPGMDGIYASVIEIVFDNNTNSNNPHQQQQAPPRIRASFVETAQYPPCPTLKEKTDAAYDVLLPLRHTMLANVLPSFRPLTSKNARGSTCTMGKLICSMLREALGHNETTAVDAVLLMGGNIRGNQDYDDSAFFSLETLEAEIKSDEVIGLVDMPGHVLAAGIEATHRGDPIPGWFQYDDGIRQDETTGRITAVGGQPLEPHRIYRVATKCKDLTNGQSPPLTAYYKAHPELLPSKGQYINIHSELMAFFARGMFRKLWEATGVTLSTAQTTTGGTGNTDDRTTNNVVDNNPQQHPSLLLEGQLRLSVLDRDQDGYVSVDDIHVAMRDYLGLSVNDDYKTLAEHVHAFADVTGNGQVTVEDFEIFCRTGMPRLQEPKWDRVFPDPLPNLTAAAAAEATTTCEHDLDDVCKNIETNHGDEEATATESSNTIVDDEDSQSEQATDPVAGTHNNQHRTEQFEDASRSLSPPFSEITIRAVAD